MERSAERRPLYYGWVVTAASFAALGATWGAQSSFGAFVNPLSEEMGWSRTAVSAAYSISISINFVFGVVWGWVSDRWSARWVVLVAGALMGLGIFLSGFVDQLWQLYALFGFTAGLGAAGASGPLGAITARWFEGRRGLAIGIAYAGVGAGSAGLPILAVRLISHGGWRFGFQGLSFLVWGVFLLAAILMRDRPRQPGAAVAATKPVTGDAGDTPLLTAVRTRRFWTMFGMEMTATTVLFMVLGHLVPRAVDGGISASTAVTLLTALGLVSMVMHLGAGALGDRVGPRRVFAGALLLCALALVWLTFVSSLWAFYVFAVVFGIGFGGWSPQMAAMVARVFGATHMGAIWGAILLAAGVGGFTGPIVAGYIFDTSGSYRLAFVVGAFVATAGVILAMLSGRPSRPLSMQTPESTTGDLDTPKRLP